MPSMVGWWQTFHLSPWEQFVFCAADALSGREGIQKNLETGERKLKQKSRTMVRFQSCLLRNFYMT